jgi:hypothetical protein
MTAFAGTARRQAMEGEESTITRRRFGLPNGLGRLTVRVAQLD